MKEWMVSISRSGAPTAGEKELRAREQQRLQDLMREKILLSVNMNTDGSRMWLHFRIDERLLLEDIIRTLPYCSGLAHRIDELIVHRP